MATSSEAREALARNPLWYHSIELAPGVVTPGWFDLRPILETMPWPDVRGKRCLDVGTYDGFLAFEMERRGAAEVVATDVASHEGWDWPARIASRGPEHLAQTAGEKGQGFEIAKEVLGSRVRKVETSVYDLSADELGSFDVVVCGSLMLHLREPVRALEAIRGVCSGRFLSAEQVEWWLTRLAPDRSLARLDGTSDRLNWWLPNAAGHRQMLDAAGFRVERQTGLYAIPLGKGHPQRGARSLGVLGQRLLGGGIGVAHAAALATPDI